MAKIQNYLEHVNKSVEREPEAFVEACETRYRNIILGIADKIYENGHIEIVLLAGPSCSGKTTTARILSEELSRLGRKTYSVSLDDFYKHKSEAVYDEDGMIDLESIDSLHVDLLIEKLNEIVKTGTAKLPTFDFPSGIREDNAWEIKLQPGDVVIVEGLHALNPLIREQLPQENILSLYVNVSSRIYDRSGKIILTKRDMRFIRRVIRDYQFRNSPTENTYYLWKGVTKGEDLYLFPYRDTADIKINSIHLYETTIFHDIAIEHLREIKKGSPYYNNATKLIRSLKKFNVLPQAIVPENSLLREFIGPNR